MIDNRADDQQKLEYPFSVQKRPSMYLGERGTQQSVGLREIIDNSVHEVIRGFADKVKITFHKNGSYSVQDNGRGLPVDESKQYKTNGIILTMATLHSGGNFSNNVAVGKAGAGLNGVGASATNALSSRFDVKVLKDKKIHSLSFQDGYAGHFDGDGPDASFKKNEKIAVLPDKRTSTEKKEFKTGTLIHLWYNSSRFPKGEKVDIDNLVDRLKYIAYIVQGITIEIVDETRENEDGSYFAWKFQSEHGIPELVQLISPDEQIPDTGTNGDEFSKEGIHSFSLEAPYKEVVTDENGMVTTIDRVATADVSFRYGTGYEKTLVSFVNTIHTHLGGVHEQAFEKALLDSFGQKIQSIRGLMTAKDEPPIVEDYFEGMTAVISVNIPEPQFVGQQKDKVSGPEVKKTLTKELTTELSKFVNNAGNQKFLRPMFEKIVQTARNRQKARDQRDLNRKKNKISSSSLPTKLLDCEFAGTDDAELYICEGDSAIGSLKQARDGKTNALLAIRGKIINAHKQTMKNVLDNSEVQDIIKTLGAGAGADFDIDKIRYGRVFIAVDADPDGNAIACLIYALFWHLFKPVIELGMLYKIETPLFAITTSEGRNSRKLYARDERGRDSIMTELESNNIKYKVSRLKGLGEVEPDILEETAIDTETRIVTQITVPDVEKAMVSLNLIFGEDTDERKSWMENYELDNEEVL